LITRHLAKGAARPFGRSCLAFALVAALAGSMASGCGASKSETGATGAASPAVSNLTVGLGYIQSVQFAQFYLADQAGYYRDARLAVTFDNRTDTDVITLLGQGAIDIGIADGTSVIPAVNHGIPVRYVATIYAQFPNIVFAKASSGITAAKDLRGKKLGTPGKYGSSWIMLQALLGSAGLTTADLTVETYPEYGQGVALAQDAIDAATGFVNNEPVQLELSGTPASILHVDQIVPLPGNGLIAAADTIVAKRTALKAFVGATLRAMKDIEADPQKGLDASIKVQPLLGEDPATQLAILRATIATWSSSYTKEHGLGAIDSPAWSTTVGFMAGLRESPVSGSPPPTDQLIDKSLLGP
jgi:NitT/TauT family transport system substrate-binding protein